MLPIVSIVGRPNVGKSTLFNRIVGERQAIVDDKPGVTRDRHYGEGFWNGVDFTVIDTGGYLRDDKEVVFQGVREQVEIAINQSDIIIFVVDGLQGETDLDEEVADQLRRQKKPVVLAVNKSDNQERIWSAQEFHSMGFKELFAISSTSGIGTGELLDAVVSHLPTPNIVEQQEDVHSEPKIAFVGRPNVGKSSLLNALLKDERSIVTDIPGTTRDAINSSLKYKDRDLILVDTAGLRRKTRVKENIEFYSSIRTSKSIRESDVVVLLIDSVQGVEKQDIKILKEAEQFNKGLIIALNKWDLVEKETNTERDYRNFIYEMLPDLNYVPIITISAVTRQRITKVLDLCLDVLEERKKKISTRALNDFMQKITNERPLPMSGRRQLSLKYATQVKANPPVFIFFMNKPDELPPNYRRFIHNKMREEFGFKGVPVTLTFRENK